MSELTREQLMEQVETLTAERDAARTTGKHLARQWELSEQRTDAAEAENARLRELVTGALQALKLRMIFVGWPAEATWQPHDKPIPDWRKEFALIEETLLALSPEVK